MEEEKKEIETNAEPVVLDNTNIEAPVVDTPVEPVPAVTPVEIPVEAPVPEVTPAVEIPVEPVPVVTPVEAPVEAPVPEVTPAVEMPAEPVPEVTPLDAAPIVEATPVPEVTPVETPAIETPAPAPTEPKKKSKLPLILLLIVILAVGGLAVWFFVLGGNGSKEQKKEEPKKEEKKEEKRDKSKEFVDITDTLESLEFEGKKVKIVITQPDDGYYKKVSLDDKELFNTRELEGIEKIYQLGNKFLFITIGSETLSNRLHVYDMDGNSIKDIYELEEPGMLIANKSIGDDTFSIDMTVKTDTIEFVGTRLLDGTDLITSVEPRETVHICDGDVDKSTVISAKYILDSNFEIKRVEKSIVKLEDKINTLCKK